LGCKAKAVEPDLEESTSEEKDAFIAIQQQLGEESVAKLTLQEAVRQEAYQQKFDAVTVFEYNVSLNQKTSFCEALKLAVKPGGIVYIHSVEKERCVLTRGYEAMYLLDELGNHFSTVMYEHRQYGYVNDGLITCRYPYGVPACNFV